MSDITIEVLSSGDAKAAKLSLPEAIFGANVNIPLIHQVVVAQLAAARQGTHATKTRGEVSGGGIKPWRQKGTGRARQGSRRAPQWAGGGTVFGPQPRSYAQRTPKKMIAAALCSVLSDRVSAGSLFVLDCLVSDETPSTRQALQALSVIGGYRSALVVLHRDEDTAWLSLRNVPNVHAIAVDQLNVYDVVANEAIVFTKPALDEFVARFGVTELVSSDEAATPSEKPAKAVKAVKAAQPLEVEEPAPEPEPAEPTPEPEEPAAEPEEPAAAEPEPEAEAVEPAVPVHEAKEAKEAKDYGEGSYRGPNPPEGFDIKGNEDSMKFHTPASPWYKRTVAEVWFSSPEAAKQAGFVDVMEGKK